MPFLLLSSQWNYPYQKLIGRINHVTSLTVLAQWRLHPTSTADLYALDRRFKANLGTILRSFGQYFTFFDQNRKLYAVNRAFDNVITAIANAHKLSSHKSQVTLTYYRSSKLNVNIGVFLLNEHSEQLECEFYFTIGVLYSIQVDIYVKEVQILSVSKQHNLDFTAKSFCLWQERGRGGWVNGVQMIALLFISYILFKTLECIKQKYSKLRIWRRFAWK